MKILFADSFPAAAVPDVEALGYTVVMRPELGAGDLPGAIDDVDVLVVRSTEVTSATISAAGPLALIVRAGAGTNTIDSAAAAARGIFVANVPGKNAIAVAELTLGLILALDRRIPDNVISARAGAWKKKEYSKGEGLAGRSLGIVGMGQVGLAVAERATGFALRVLTTQKQRDAATEHRMQEAGVVTVPGLRELAAASDIISLHVPSSVDTVGLVDRSFLAEVRDGTWIINTSRGDVVDEAALIEAIEVKGLRVGLDVFADEPASGEGEFHSPLAQHPAVYTTHHIGASTAQAQRAVAEGVIDVLAAFARGQALNAVNLTPPEPVGAVLMVRHSDRVGVLSAVLRVVRDAGLNVQEMTNQPFVGAGAAVASIHVIGGIPGDMASRVNAVPDVIHCSVRPLT